MSQRDRPIGTMTDHATGETLDILETWEDDRGRIVKLRAADGRISHRLLRNARVESFGMTASRPGAARPGWTNAEQDEWTADPS